MNEFHSKFINISVADKTIKLKLYVIVNSLTEHSLLRYYQNNTHKIFLWVENYYLVIHNSNIINVGQL